MDSLTQYSVAYLYDLSHLFYLLGHVGIPAQATGTIRISSQG